MKHRCRGVERELPVAAGASDACERRGVPMANALVLMLLVAVGQWLAAAPAARATESLARVAADIGPKMVKIYGAGGFRRLEAYQTGMLISAEGHILTVWSYVLDTDQVKVVLDDGQRFDARLLGADPHLEVAVLKIEAEGLPYFDLAQATEAEVGTAVLAASNLFGIATGNEPVSVLHGYVAARTHLQARRGVFETPYRGEVYVLDAMTNNPGAAGGALTDAEGRLIGMLGKELRNAQNNTWLNYAIPISQLRSVVEEIQSGQFESRPERADRPRPERPLDLTALGIRLVPNVVERTPPFVDEVLAGSAAEAAGLRPDDLILFVGERLVQSCRDVVGELSWLDRQEEVALTVLRDGELVEMKLRPASIEHAAPERRGNAAGLPDEERADRQEATERGGNEP